MGADFVEALRQYMADGLRQAEAAERAFLDFRLAHWPAEWGDDLHVLICGALWVEERLDFPDLGITILPDRDTRIPGLLAFKTHVRLNSRDADGLGDAVDRLETLLGMMAVCGQARTLHWLTLWPEAIEEPVLQPDADLLARALQYLSQFSEEKQEMIKRAAWWLRSQRDLSFGWGPGPSVFRRFIAAWNAFECLVKVVCADHPPKKLPRSEKNRLIAQRLADLGRVPEVGDIYELYGEIVDPGQKAKIPHVLDWAFRTIADQYGTEMFGPGPGQPGLYDIRNDIHHANMAESDSEKRALVRRALPSIEHIALVLFGLIVGFGVRPDYRVRCCLSCANWAADACTQGLLPGAEQGWHYVCDAFTPGKQYWPALLLWPPEADGDPGETP